MPHLELSVSEPHALRHTPRSPLERWAATVAEAEELCLVLDADDAIVAASPAFERLIGADGPLTGRYVLDGTLELRDFADGGVLSEDEAGKIPPILAITSRRLARGLVRIRSAEGLCTLDAIATPLLDGESPDRPAGSLTFFSRV